MRLRGNDYFEAILFEFKLRREAAIGSLGSYETDTELRKVSAEITALTEILDSIEFAEVDVKG